MGLCYMLLLISMLAGLCTIESVRASNSRNRLVPGSPYNVSRNDRGVLEAVLTGTEAFNNQSNDAFLFKASAVQDAQSQIVKGIRYIVDVEISRTLCRKKDHNTDLANCKFQPDGLLHQTFLCHFEVWAMPWLRLMRTIYFLCHER